MSLDVNGVFNGTGGTAIQIDFDMPIKLPQTSGMSNCPTETRLTTGPNLIQRRVDIDLSIFYPSDSRSSDLLQRQIPHLRPLPKPKPTRTPSTPTPKHKRKPKGQGPSTSPGPSPGQRPNAHSQATAQIQAQVEPNLKPTPMGNVQAHYTFD